MTTIGSEDFHKPDQSQWGTDLLGNIWALVRGSSTFSISSNQGAVAGNSASFCNERCGSGTTVNSDQTVTFNRATTSDVAGVFCRFIDANNWYACNIGEFTSNLVISKFVGGSYSDIDFGPGATYGTGTTWAIRFQNIGTALRGKIWDNSGMEPPAWTIDTTDASLSSAGGFGVLADPFTASPMDFLSYVATDASTGPTLNPMTFTDALSASDLIGKATGASATEALSILDRTLDQNRVARTESLVALDQLLRAGAMVPIEHTSILDQLRETDLAPFLDALSGSDILDMTNVTPATATIPLLLALATFRSGSVAAHYRNGLVTAGGR